MHRSPPKPLPFGVYGCRAPFPPSKCFKSLQSAFPYMISGGQDEPRAGQGRGGSGASKGGGSGEGGLGRLGGREGTEEREKTDPQP